MGILSLMGSAAATGSMLLPLSNFGSRLLREYSRHSVGHRWLSIMERAYKEDPQTAKAMETPFVRFAELYFSPQDAPPNDTSGKTTKPKRNLTPPD